MAQDHAGMSLLGVSWQKRVVLILGPSLAAVSGVSTHVGMLMGSRLNDKFQLEHFQVGTEGRGERQLLRWARLFIDPFRFALKIIASNVAIVHVNTSMDPRAFWRDFCFTLFGRLLGVAVVYQIHGGELPDVFAGNSWLRNVSMRWVLRLASATVVLGQRELTAYQRWVPAARLHHYPNAIDVARYSAYVERSDHAELRLVYIGRLASAKGLFELIDAMGRLRRQDRVPRLTIAGTGRDVDALKQHAKALGLQGLVTFRGPVFGEEKISLWMQSDIFVFPSYHEGLPYALLESMAAGVPVVTTPVGAIPDVVTDGTHGLLVPPRDDEAIAAAVAALDDNRERIKAMRTACRKRVSEEYSLERLTRDFEGLYSALIVAGRARAVVYR